MMMVETTCIFKKSKLLLAFSVNLAKTEECNKIYTTESSNSSSQHTHNLWKKTDA